MALGEYQLSLVPILTLWLSWIYTYSVSCIDIIDGYSVNVGTEVLSPTFVQIHWEIQVPINTSETDMAMNIYVFHHTSTGGKGKQPEQHLDIEISINTITRPGNYTLGPFQSGSTKTFSLKPVITTSSQDTIFFGPFQSKLSLPACDVDCNHPLGGEQDLTCSFCTCKKLFKGPNCKDPAFHPTGVSAWPTDASTLQVQWDFDASKYAPLLRDADTKIVEFLLEVTSESGTNRMISDIDPMQRIYFVESIQPGEEHMVSVGAITDTAITAWSDSVASVIPVSLLSNSTDAGSSEDSVWITVAAALSSSVLVGIVSIIATVFFVKKVCRQRRTCDAKVTVPIRVPPCSCEVPTVNNPAYGRVKPTASAGSSENVNQPNDAALGSYISEGPYYNSVHFPGESFETTGNSTSYDYI